MHRLCFCVFAKFTPLKWMAAQVDVPELVNFFEARNVNYEVGLPRQ